MTARTVNGEDGYGVHPLFEGASPRGGLRLALRAATLYYREGLTQAEIAARLGVSRPTAGRLVARAKANGLIQIKLVVPPDMRDDLHPAEERELEQRFGLTEAVIAGRGIDAGVPAQAAALASVGRAAAALLTRRLSATDTMGFIWAPEIEALARGLSGGLATCRAVAQLDGAGSTAAYRRRADYILGRCAEALRAKVVRPPRPLCAEPSMVSSMRYGSEISRRLEAGRRADVMLFGVGAVSACTTRFQGSFIGARILDELMSLGAVGNIGGHFFDAHGAALDTDLQRGVVSVPLEDIRSCPKTILVSSGADKHCATLGALNGGLARLLVCDIDCARWLLRE